MEQSLPGVCLELRFPTDLESFMGSIVENEDFREDLFSRCPTLQAFEIRPKYTRVKSIARNIRKNYQALEKLNGFYELENLTRAPQQPTLNKITQPDSIYYPISLEGRVNFDRQQFMDSVASTLLPTLQGNKFKIKITKPYVNCNGSRMEQPFTTDTLEITPNRERGKLFPIKQKFNLSLEGQYGFEEINDTPGVELKRYEE